MKVVASLPHRVVVHEHVWIPMPDGVRLAAKLWLPEGASEQPVPAVVEYIPYRKRDVEAVPDSVTHGYFAGHGYGCVRVDLRGSGDSEGVLQDEYLERELADGEALLAWVASQPWCNGRVGIIGISWGGFNGLQLAARSPAALAGVVTVCSTDDRYADDVHYMGGCLLGDNLSWASTMLAFNALPPDPALVGAGWLDQWRARLEGSGAWIETWMRHARRDAYWCHGSVAEDIQAITCPVLAVSGWAYGYSNAVFRLAADLPRTAWGIVGPWSHMYPHFGVPGPAIGFLQECVRFWRHCFGEGDSDWARTPRIRAYLQEVVRPRAAYDERPGHWVGDAVWPSPLAERARFGLAPGRLVPATEGHAGGSVAVCSPAWTGIAGGKWCSYSVLPDQPIDQRFDDAGSACFDSDPLLSPLALLGAPVATLEVSVDQPVAQLAARLCAVAPDGSSARLSFGLLNLTHRGGHVEPEPLEPGRRYRVRIGFNDLGVVVPPGHRLRLALSTAYFPMAWPAPRAATVELHLAECVLEVPVHVPDPEVAPVAFEEPEGALPLETIELRPPERSWRITIDAASGRSIVHVLSDGGEARLPHADLSISRRTDETYSIHPDDPASAQGTVRALQRLWRDGWSVTVQTETTLTTTATDFGVEVSVTAHAGDELVHARSTTTRIPRDLV
jgi:uncharacterized protein